MMADCQRDKTKRVFGSALGINWASLANTSDMPTDACLVLVSSAQVVEKSRCAPRDAAGLGGAVQAYARSALRPLCGMVAAIEPGALALSRDTEAFMDTLRVARWRQMDTVKLVYRELGERTSGCNLDIQNRPADGEEVVERLYQALRTGGTGVQWNGIAIDADLIACLARLAMLLGGEFSLEAGFYDAERLSAKVPSSAMLFRRLRRLPPHARDYWLVPLGVEA